MAKSVYFVRHGECQANVDGVIAGGALDSPLTQRGKQQALELAKKIKDINFDLIVSSPLSRALDTAKIISDELNANHKIVIKQEFIEKNVGEFTGKTSEEYFTFEQTGEETGEISQDMQDRVRKGLLWLKDQKFENALVVTHNGTIRMIQTVFEKLPAKQFAHLSMPNNGEYYLVDLDKVST